MKLLSTFTFSLFAVLLFSQGSLAQEENRLSRSVKPGLLHDKTWTLSVGVSPSPTNIVHRDDLSAAGAASVDTISSVGNNEISFRVAKEFFEHSRFSISVLGSIGGFIGSHRDKNLTEIEYAQRTKGFQFGGGASFNLNFYGMGFGIQPFLSAEVYSRDLEYELDYRTEGQPVVISNQESSVVLEPSLGIRVFDPQTSIMSFISVGSAQFLNRSVESTLNINEQGPQALAFDDGNIQTNEFTFRIGFGYFF